MSGYVVIERTTGPDKQDDNVFGPFPANAVADLWIEKRKKEVLAWAEITGAKAMLRRNPKIYLINPLYEPNW